MKIATQNGTWIARLAAAVLSFTLGSGFGHAAITFFFNGSQTTNLVDSATTSDTLSSQGYLFTLSRDKLFTGGVGMTNPIGRTVRIPWPKGLEAQAVTAGPSPSGATITIKRQDGQPFSIESFTGKLLANTAGAGGSFEIMPMLNGQDGLQDPLALDATGYAGNTFSYATPSLTGFDTYTIKLYVDFALTALTVVDASPPDPVLSISRAGAGLVEISWPTNAVGYSLEAVARLPATLWRPVTNSPSVNGDLFTVQMETTESCQVYRLRK